MGIKAFFEKLFGKNGNNAGQAGETGKSDGKDGRRMVCVECKSGFLFESGEQQFFKMRGLTPPKRCPSCRSKRKRKR